MTIHPISPVAVTANAVGDLLASVANVFGYTPTESLVVIGLTRDNRLSTHVRVDLHKALPIAHDFGAEIGRMMSLEHAQCIALALTEEAPAPGAYSDTLAHQGSAFCAGLESAGITVKNAWHIGNNYSRPMLDSDPASAPYPGELIDPTTPTAQALKPHKATSPQEIVESYQAPHTAPTPPQGSTITGLQLWDEIAADTIDTANLTALETGHLVAALAAHPMAIIATVAADLLEGISALGSDDDRELPRTVQAIGDAPDWNRIDRLAAMLKTLTPYTVQRASSNVHAIMSWINYAKGRGTLALAFAEQAQHDSPGNHLARSIHQLAINGTVSPWAVYSWTAYKGN